MLCQACDWSGLTIVMCLRILLGCDRRWEKYLGTKSHQSAVSLLMAMLGGNVQWA